MYRRGFTVVEVLITLIVITVLMTFSVVSLRSTQSNARDTERKNDIDVLSRGLETYYTKGNPKVDQNVISPGAYPGPDIMKHILGANVCSVTFSASLTPCDTTGAPYFEQALPGVTLAAITSPAGSGSKLTVVTSSSFDETTALNSGVYLYKPLTSAATTVCTSATCPRFELKYKNDVDSSVVTLKSRRQ